MATNQTHWGAAAILRWVGLLLLVAAYLQGGINKAFDFTGAIAEMRHFGVESAVPAALATIVLELGACLMVLTGRFRWLGAAALAVFTLVASLLTYRFWSAPAIDRFALENAFFEHLGLVGSVLLVALADLQGSTSIADCAGS
jgi:uncharacterized membrane protein YphA (DoxX/SURF4 family)